LPEKKRVVFLLHELEGMAPSEIAAVVDAPVLTVRTRLFYARKELCDMMQGEPALAGLVADLGVDRARVSFSGREPARADLRKADPDRADAEGEDGPT
jgi:RNA polymerase sigma-70 factor (ECF subfamily)